ncbi:transmembrane prediction [Novipirellula caenicola]|uniref:transmembrane prediction n=1 Tax=Novipirellula caenicola TaxID=1536901 RepID=UPI0031EB60BD
MILSKPSKTRRNHILWLVVPPGVWAVHFLASYLTIAIWCAKFAGDNADANPVRIAIAVYTVVALAIIVLMGWLSYRQHRSGGSPPHDQDTYEDHVRFVGQATFLLALLSGVATIFTALVAVFVRSCH